MVKNKIWKQIYAKQNGLDHEIDKDNFEYLINQVAEDIQQNVEEGIAVDLEFGNVGEVTIILSYVSEEKKYEFEVSVPAFTTDGDVTVNIVPLEKLPCGRLIRDYITQETDKKRRVKSFNVALERGAKSIASVIYKYFPEYAAMYDEAAAERARVGLKINNVKTAIELLAIEKNADLSSDGMSLEFDTENAMVKGSVKVVSVESGQFKLEFFTTDIDQIENAISAALKTKI